MLKKPRPTKKRVERLLREAEGVALALLEQRARAVLRRNPQLKEFVMAMGSAHFEAHDGEQVGICMSPWSHDYRKYTRPVDEVLDDFDDVLKLTGTPMRFTADGPVVTDW